MMGRQFSFVCAALGAPRKHSAYWLVPPCLPSWAVESAAPACFSEDYFPLGSASKAAELFTQSTIFLQTSDKMQFSFPISGHNDG